MGYASLIILIFRHICEDEKNLRLTLPSGGRDVCALVDGAVVIVGAVCVASCTFATLLVDMATMRTLVSPFLYALSKILLLLKA